MVQGIWAPPSAARKGILRHSNSCAFFRRSRREGTFKFEQGIKARTPKVVTPKVPLSLLAICTDMPLRIVKKGPLDPRLQPETSRDPKPKP